MVATRCRLSLRTVAVTVAVLVTVGACSSSATPSPTPTASSPVSSTAAPPPQPSVSSSPSETRSAAAPSGSAQAGVTPDPCELYTVAEASTLIGAALVKTQGGDLGGGGRNCVYSSGPSSHVTVFDRTLASASQADAVFKMIEAQEGAATGATTSTIAGLGDGAFIVRQPGAGSLAAIGFVSGPTYVSLTTYPGPSDAALKVAAMTALGRL